MTKQAKHIMPYPPEFRRDQPGRLAPAMGPPQQDLPG